MNPTKEQLTELKAEKTISIPMELEKCYKCFGDGKHHSRNHADVECIWCSGTGQTSKYQVGDVIFIHKPTGKLVIGLKSDEDYEDEILKLKIISIDKEKKEMRAGGV